MSSMFGLIAVDPDLGPETNIQRMFLILLTEAPEGQVWAPIEKEIIRLFSDENCRAVRSLVWQKLPDIIALADVIQGEIKEKTKRNYRYCYAEGLLVATYLTIWDQPDEIDAHFIRDFLDSYYKWQPLEERESEPELMLNRILSESIYISHRVNSRTLRGVIEIIRDGGLTREDGDLDPGTLSEFKIAAGRYGLAWIKTKKGDVLAIMNAQHDIMKMLAKGHGYHKILGRHPKVSDRQRQVSIPGQGSKKATTFIGVI